MRSVSLRAGESLFLVVVGMGDSVHLLSVYRDRRKHGEGTEDALVAATASVGVPVFYTSLTTAFGLAVGIPALLAHRFTLSRVDTLVLELEEEAISLLDLMREGGREPSPEPAQDAAE